MTFGLWCGRVRVSRAVRPAALGPLLIWMLPGHLNAQVRGTVIDSVGTAVPAVQVDVWDRTRRLARTSTDGRGRFEFSLLPAVEVTTLVARHAGYAPARVDLRGVSYPVTVVLVGRALPVSPVELAASAPCPNAEDPDARALWEAVRSRYRTPTSGAWTDTRGELGRVSGAEFGVVDLKGGRSGEIGWSAPSFAAERARLAGTGYAVPAQASVHPRFGAWQYPDLQGSIAWHFVDSLFGRLHTFSLESRDSKRLIVFCPRARDKGRIEGVLEVSPDSQLARATWRFRTPAPEEQAGGEAAFAARPRGAEPGPLFPVYGMFWRKLVFDFYQEWTEYLGWKDCDADPSGRVCQALRQRH